MIHSLHGQALRNLLARRLCTGLTGVATLGNTLPPALLALVAAPLITALATWSPARRAAVLPIVEAIRRDVA